MKLPNRLYPVLCALTVVVSILLFGAFLGLALFYEIPGYNILRMSLLTAGMLTFWWAVGLSVFGGVRGRMRRDRELVVWALTVLCVGVLPPLALVAVGILIGF